jgi:hypothetical protein
VPANGKILEHQRPGLRVLVKDIYKDELFTSVDGAVAQRQQTSILDTSL